MPDISPRGHGSNHDYAAISRACSRSSYRLDPGARWVPETYSEVRWMGARVLLIACNEACVLPAWR
jgi:hypothetical protein